ncbi:hypothetical protein LSH36_721g03015 [Paralvinella palmiformis]|uniref:FAD-binding domain-containing protein n=1 Tax=Paralvinella palmiformis TaxID=53620 RepID=A0AAD9MT74_9ANNE|nr:hypothetical protein LSH36_721g03015 [Paralvinella palmiformis]
MPQEPPEVKDLLVYFDCTYDPKENDVKKKQVVVLGAGLVGALNAPFFAKRGYHVQIGQGDEVAVSYDLIVGCDGAHSAVRRQMMRSTLLDYSQEYIPHGYVRMRIPPTKDGQYESIHNEHDLLTFFETEFPTAVPLTGRKAIAKSFFSKKELPLITHLRYAVMVSACRLFLQSVCNFLSIEKDRSDSALLWGRPISAANSIAMDRKRITPIAVLIAMTFPQMWSRRR